MHISLDSALGRQKRLNSVGESVLQIAPDAAAAYSLRSLTGGDPDVVRVRRESDNTEKDFSGSQIESGEMARWVNEQPTLPLDLRELDTNTGERDGALIEAAAAYSLRKLKEDFTGDVVEVRRNVDGETEGFTADEVTDGTLESFVNASFDEELPLDQATGAAAAYSLRNLSSSFTGDVVQVRRSSDDAVQSFTASEVADGTLEAWVNTDVTIYQSDFSSSIDGWNGASVVSLVGGEDGVSDGTTSKDNVLKLTKNQDSQAYIARDQGVIAGLTYTVSGSFYAPLSNTGVDGILIKDGIAGGLLLNYPSGYLTASGVWTDFSFSYTATVSGDQRINMGISSLGSNPNGSSAGSSGDVVYISDLQFVETTSNGHVRTWYDQSGSDNHAVQTTPANQPKIVEGGSLNRDSDNNVAVKFDSSSDQYLENASLPSSFTSSNVTFSDFTVQEALQNNVTTMAWGFGSTSSSAVRLNKLFHSGGNFGYQGYGSTASYVSAFDAASYSANEVLLSSGVRVGTDLDIFKNSADADMDNSFDTGTINLNTFAIGSYVRSSGSTNPFNGNIAEVIIYDSDQSTKRRAIEENIANHYDISLAAFSRDGTVSTWYDQSGNTNDATQTDPTKQPKIVEGGTLQKDSRNNPAIVFDDVDDNMDLTSDLVTGGAYSAIAYHEFNAPSMILKGDLNSPRIRAYANTSYQVGSLSPEVSAAFSVASSQGLVSVLKDASHNARVYANGTESSSGQQNVGSGSSPFQMLGTGISDGAANGKLVEVIYYNSDQTDNRTALEANIGETYGITGIPAANDTVTGFVQTWYDQSGEGNDAEQIAADKQPKIVDGGVLVSGGILSDGAGTFLEFDSTLSITDEFDIFFTGTATASNWTTLQRSPYGLSTNSDYPRFNDDSYRYTINGTDSGLTNYNSGFTIGADTPFIYNFNRNSSDSVGCQINGTAQTNRATLSGTHKISQLFRRGTNTTQIWDGTMSEMIFYDSDQTANRPAIETNIANQYGITLSY